MNAPAAAVSDDLFRLMAEQNSLGIVLTDLAGTVLYANPRQVEASGYALEELVGRNASIFSAGETPREVFEVLWETILAGRVWNGELVNRRKNGEIIRELVRIAPIRDAAGAITHFFSIKQESLFGKGHNLLGGAVATVDPLTGLPNRAMLLDRIANRIAETQGDRHSLALMVVDIDQFRAFNESFGPLRADEFLKRVAARLRYGVRENDMVARIGGNEFGLLLLGGENELLLEQMARRLLASAFSPVELDGRSATASGSIGIARCPLDAREAEALLQCAEAALAAVKSAGGDDLRFYVPPVDELAREWGDLGQALREVTRRDELLLHYQPKVDLRTGGIVGFEALVRWQHPLHGMLAPSRFVPVAEETGLIVNLSQWVIRSVLRQLRAWQNAGLRPPTVGVNTSLRHFRSGDLPAFIAAELAASGVDPGLLEIEIGESAMMRDPTHAFIVVDRIRSLGVRLTMDEFGTGLSSLSYLSRMHVDKLKIDRFFVREITTNPVNASIVAAIVAMAHKLGKRVIAVGVESEGQALQLRRYDCDEIQGFYFSRPGSAADMEALLADGRHLGLKAEAAKEKTLLLVDDEANILSALRRMLRHEGYTILSAESGEAALELLATRKVQVIVSDQRMPGMSGVELLSRVRELYPDTRRIILSGYSDIATLADAINRGAVWKYIAKPWDDAALRAEIRQAFDVAA